LKKKIILMRHVHHEIEEIVHRDMLITTIEVLLILAMYLEGLVLEETPIEAATQDLI
jgi:hypothetical protein